MQDSRSICNPRGTPDSPAVCVGAPDRSAMQGDVLDTAPTD
jgi:hypothetical protein